MNLIYICNIFHYFHNMSFIRFIISFSAQFLHCDLSRIWAITLDIRRSINDDKQLEWPLTRHSWLWGNPDIPQLDNRSNLDPAVTTAQFYCRQVFFIYVSEYDLDLTSTRLNFLANIVNNDLIYIAKQKVLSEFIFGNRFSCCTFIFGTKLKTCSGLVIFNRESFLSYFFLLGIWASLQTS